MSNSPNEEAIQLTPETAGTPPTVADGAKFEHRRGSSINGMRPSGIYDTRTQNFTPPPGYDSRTSTGVSSGVGTRPADSSKRYDYKSASHGPNTGAGTLNMGEEFGRGVKGVAAGIHGAGECFRGELNAAVDRAFGHESGVAKNTAIAQEGEREIQSGNFAERS